MLRWDWNRVFARFYFKGTDWFYDLMIGNCFGVFATPVYWNDGRMTDQRHFDGVWMNKPEEIQWIIDNYFSVNLLTINGKQVREIDALERVEIKRERYADEFDIYEDDDITKAKIGNELDTFAQILRKNGIEVRLVSNFTGEN